MATTGDAFYSSVTQAMVYHGEEWTDIARWEDSEETSLVDSQMQPDQGGHQGEPHGESGEPDRAEDFTMILKVLDAQFEKLDTDKALRSTIIKAGTTWTRKHQENLLCPLKALSLTASVVDDEKKKAFDLLDAISRSGTLPIDCAELHVVVAVSHCFENDVMGTIVQENINPIEKVEKSALIIASTIYGKQTNGLVHDERQLEQLIATFPRLFAG